MHKILKLLFLVGASSTLLISCVPSVPEKKTASGKVTEGAGSVTVFPSKTVFISGSLTTLGKEDIFYSWAPTLNSTGLSFSAVGLPAWASLNTTTGEITGTPRDNSNYDNIIIRASKLNLYTEIGPFSLKVFGDPLKIHTWHLSNTGQSNFSDGTGTKGTDISQDQVTKNNQFGRDVRIAVSDTGLDIDHPDLAINVLTPLSKDYNLAAPYFGDPGVIANGDHGTSVAGLIAAVGWNEIGSRGVAPEAKIIGLNFLSGTQTTATKLDQASDDFDIFNYSYGSSFYPTAENADSSYNDQLKYSVKNNRGGKGSVFVKSAGNSFSECDYSSASFYPGLTCFSHNSNLGLDDELPWFISVAASNALGVKSSYSSHGANLWITAPGGEFGVDSPAIMTTDVAGCTDGYARQGIQDRAFKKGGDGNTDCNYVQDFSGTSAAAPIVSGVVAAMIGVNSGLTWRDVKHILASTAQKIDALSSAKIVNPTFDFDNGRFITLTNSKMDGHTYSQGWTTNSAGYSFHNYYGFGQVDMDAAVSMAKNYSAGTWGVLNETDPDFTSSISSVNAVIPDNDKAGLTDSIAVAQTYTIESVQIRVNITHARPGDLGIELTSPSGTKSIILNINNSLLIGLAGVNPDWIDNHTNAVFLSNAFYGESANGNWSIKIIDGLGAATGNIPLDTAASQSGTFVDWSINVLGQ